MTVVQSGARADVVRGRTRVDELADEARAHERRRRGERGLTRDQVDTSVDELPD